MNNQLREALLERTESVRKWAHNRKTIQFVNKEILCSSGYFRQDIDAVLEIMWRRYCPASAHDAEAKILQSIQQKEAPDVTL